MSILIPKYVGKIVFAQNILILGGFRADFLKFWPFLILLNSARLEKMQFFLCPSLSQLDDDSRDGGYSPFPAFLYV